jgi:hypothetical protein
MKRTPRVKRDDGRDAAEAMQQRQRAAKDEAIRRLLMAKRISSAAGKASN